MSDFEFDAVGFVVRLIIGYGIAYAVSYYKAYKVD